MYHRSIEAGEGIHGSRSELQTASRAARNTNPDDSNNSRDNHLLSFIGETADDATNESQGGKQCSPTIDPGLQQSGSLAVSDAVGLSLSLFGTMILSTFY